MNSESHRIWRNRNAYAFVAALSLFLLLFPLERLLTWKDTDVLNILEVFLIGFLVIRCSYLAKTADAQLWSRREETGMQTEARLDELERLKRRAMVTPEEYEAKRKDILDDL
jgi:hypothetical protein